MSPERPVFGKPERRRKLQPPEHQQILQAVRLIPLVREALVVSEKTYQEARETRREKFEEAARLVWGEEFKFPRRVHPSIATKCLRWMGYEILEEKPVEQTPEQVLPLMLGRSSHYEILRALQPYGASESSFVLENEEMSGRLDLLLPNPLLNVYQVLELKTTGIWGFKKITREGIPSWMRKEKNLYNPRPEDKLQLLLYMWAKREEGKKVDFGNIIYIDRDSGKMKECVVIWSAEAEYEVKEFLGKVKKAKEALAQGKLPEASVDPRSASYLCGGICSFRDRCGPGRRFAAGEVKRKRKYIPQFARIDARRKIEELRKTMESLGLTQPSLPGFEGDSPKENSSLICADCGRKMSWDRKAARGGKYVCPQCGNA